MKAFFILYLFISVKYFLGFCTAAWIHDDAGCLTPDKARGTCIRVNDCKPITDFILSSQSVNQEMRNFLKPYTCGYETNNDVKVCCPTNPIKNPFMKSNNVRKDKMQLLPLETCGIQNTDKIINGRDAELFEFPWMAVLLYSGTSDPYQCGGTVINDRYVLTSAHCIHTSKIKLIGVRLGEYNLNSEIDCDPIAPTSCAGPVQNFDVNLNDVVVHPNYDNRTLANDIALIRLRRTANLSVDSVKPICLPLEDNINTKKKFIVTGWGLTESGFRSPTLKKANLNLAPAEECMISYRNFKSYMHHENQLCTNGRGGAKNQNSCSGDSGGPLMSRAVQTGQVRMIQVGIVSFGINGCQLNIRHDFPSVFTKVNPYIDWILETLQP